jgi:hypothetical protein
MSRSLCKALQGKNSASSGVMTIDNSQRAADTWAVKPGQVTISAIKPRTL